MKPYAPPGTFEEARKIMAEPYPTDFDMEPSAPWTEAEFEDFLNQEALPPNQSFQLPSEEQPIENPNQLHLNYL